MCGTMEQGALRREDLLIWRGGSATDACGAEGAVYLVRRDGIGGDGLGVLDCFGGECLDFHRTDAWVLVVNLFRVK